MNYDYETKFIDASYEFCLRILGQMDIAGWELIAVDEGTGYFRRLRKDNGKEEKVKEAHAEEDTDQSQRCSTAGQLYSRAYE